MDLIGIFFGRTQTKDIIRGEFANIEFDAVLLESHQWSADATSNPVETGSPITDHVIEQADKLALTGFISDSSITLSSNLAIFSGNKPKTQIAFDALREAIKAKETVTIYTKFKLYEDMIITKIDIPREKADGNSIEVKIELINIRKVSTALVDIPKGIGTNQANSSTANKAQKQADQGKKSPVVKPLERVSSGLSAALGIK